MDDNNLTEIEKANIKLIKEKVTKYKEVLRSYQRKRMIYLILGFVFALLVLALIIIQISLVSNEKYSEVFSTLTSLFIGLSVVMFVLSFTLYKNKIRSLKKIIDEFDDINKNL